MNQQLIFVPYMTFMYFVDVRSAMYILSERAHSRSYVKKRRSGFFNWLFFLKLNRETDYGPLFFMNIFIPIYLIVYSAAHLLVGDALYQNVISKAILSLFAVAAVLTVMCCTPLSENDRLSRKGSGFLHIMINIMLFETFSVILISQYFIIVWS